MVSHHATPTARLARDTKRRLSKVSILIADPNPRTAMLVHDVLRSFGFESIYLAKDGEAALAVLESVSIDLLLSEWDLHTTQGTRLIHHIRKQPAQSFLPADLPAIMFTAQSDSDSVRMARDAGFTEFVAKPFSAHSLSVRLLQIIEHPRQFVIAKNFVGPCRRRRTDRADHAERRRPREAVHADADVVLMPPNRRLAKLIGEDMAARDIFSPVLIERVQQELMRKETEYLAWVADDIQQLELAYDLLAQEPTNIAARQQFLATAYAIKSQAGIFGYDMGTEVTRMLLDYFHDRRAVDPRVLQVLRMHLDTIRVVFQYKIKDSTRAVAQELMQSLHKLVLRYA